MALAFYRLVVKKLCARGSRAFPSSWNQHCPSSIPTVSLDVISLAASSCGYYRGQIEHRVAHEFAVHVATQRGLAERPQHPSILFSPPGNGFSTLDARWKLLI